MNPVQLAKLRQQSLGSIVANQKASALGVSIAPKAQNNIYKASENPNTGGNLITNPVTTMPRYTGHQLDFGVARYTGLKPTNIAIKVADGAGGGSADTWLAFDKDGFSGKTNSTGVTVVVTTNNLLSTSAAYTAMNSFYARVHPMVNRIRMSVDAKGQLDYQTTIQFYDENSNVQDVFNFIPSTAIVQEDQQTTLAEMGIVFPVLANMVMFGKIDNNTNAGVNTITMFTQGYVYDATFN